MKSLIVIIYLAASINVAYNMFVPTNNISKTGAVLSLIGLTGAALNSIDD